MKVRILLILVNLVIISTVICSFVLTQKLDDIPFINDWMVLCGVFLLAAIILLPLTHIIKQEKESSQDE